MHALTSLLMIMLLSVISGCQPHANNATPAASRVQYTPQQLREDLDTLRQAVEQRHPRFHDRPLDTALVDAFDAARQALDVPMTRAEAFRVMAKVNPAFEDAHTLLMPTFDAQARSDEQQRFPIKVRLRADGVLIVVGHWQRADGTGELASGTVIRSINGETSAALLRHFSQYSHGETEALQRHMLAALFPHWLAALRGWTGDFDLEIEQDGAPRQLSILAAEHWTQASATANQPTVHDLGDGIALLRVPTFNVEADPQAYGAVIDTLFATLRQKGTRKLIVDVRGNTGGQSEAGSRIIRYFIDQPVNQVSRARERINADNRGLLPRKGSIGEMREMDLSRDGLVQPVPRQDRFHGKVVLLIDAMTYSAGILFATTLQDHQLATVMGQPTGGYANQTGNMESVRLPNTGLTANIPARIFVRPNGDTAQAPVRPDVLVEPSLEGRDAVVDAAVAYLMRP